MQEGAGVQLLNLKHIFCMVEVPRLLPNSYLRYSFLPTCSYTPRYPQGKTWEEKVPDIAASTAPERFNKDLSISPCINTGRQPRQAAPGGGSTIVLNQLHVLNHWARSVKK